MEIQVRSISELSQDPANARKHNEENIRAIMASLRRFGQQTPIVVDSSGVVRKGNGTIEAARKLGWDSVQCVTTDLKGSEAISYAIADNRTAELAEWDDEVLAAQLNGLLADDPELLNAAGFDEDELAAMLDELEPDKEIIEDEVPEPPAEPITKPGDLWILGEHRLLCGSCLDMNLMDRLFSGKMARMVFTDPPYNVAYTGGTKEKLTIKNDKMPGEQFLQFLKDAFVSMAAFTEPGSGIYVCHADSEGERFRNAFVNSGWMLKQCLIWVKNTLVLGRQDYQWRHEPILYGWREGASHRFYANRKQTTVIDESEGLTVKTHRGLSEITISFGGRTVILEASGLQVKYDAQDDFESAWRFDKPSRNGEHPTMKPVRLVARAINHCSKRGDIVFDGFLGSGTTLIACDKTERICYGTELDPKYCDVIVKRWETLTGRKATCQSVTPV